MRSCAKTSLLVLTGTQIASLRALSLVGSIPFLRTPGFDLPSWHLWLATTPPQDAIASLLRLVALGCTWWLLAGTGLHLAARLTRIPGLVRATRWTTPQAVRRLIDRAVALSFVATLAGGSAALAGGGPPPVPLPVVSPQPAPMPAAPPAQRPPDHHTVRAGDNLWSIAAGHLADRGITLSNGRIAPYWRDLVQENRATLRSGDPDLIFPGETVSLPPID